MNIINIDYEKLKEEIMEYNIRLQTLNPEFYIKYNKEPIILMNNETLKFLNQKNVYEKKCKSVPMVFGYHIAIAEWLPFGRLN